MSNEEYNPSPDSNVRAWQAKTAKNAKDTHDVVKGLLATGAATATLAAGIGYSEGKIPETSAASAAAAGLLIAGGALSKRKYEQTMGAVRAAGPSESGEMPSTQKLREFTQEHGVTFSQK